MHGEHSTVKNLNMFVGTDAISMINIFHNKIEQIFLKSTICNDKNNLVLSGQNHKEPKFLFYSRYHSIKR